MDSCRRALTRADGVLKNCQEGRARASCRAILLDKVYTSGRNCSAHAPEFAPELKDLWYRIQPVALIKATVTEGMAKAAWPVIVIDLVHIVRSNSSDAVVESMVEKAKAVIRTMYHRENKNATIPKFTGSIYLANSARTPRADSNVDSFLYRLQKELRISSKAFWNVSSMPNVALSNTASPWAALVEKARFKELFRTYYSQRVLDLWVIAVADHFIGYQDSTFAQGVNMWRLAQRYRPAVFVGKSAVTG